MSRDIDRLIMEILIESNKALTTKEISEELKRKNSDHHSRRTTNYHIENLIKSNRLKPILNERKQIAYIPMYRYKEWTEVKYQERKIHSDQLKKEILEPWYEKFPIIDKTEIFLPSSVNILIYFTGADRLDVENHDLFGDLESHLEPVIFVEWEKFKDKAVEFYEARDSILSKIDKKVENVIGLKISETWEGNIVYDRWLSIRILEAALYLGEDHDDIFKNKYLNFESQVSIEGSSLVYRIEGRAYIKVRMSENNIKGFKEIIDGKIRKLMQEANKLGRSHELHVFLKLKRELENLRYSIRSRLLQNKRKPILGGDCKYLL